MIELLNRYDITSKARREATDSAYLSDVMGLLTRERRYEISDGSSQYNPFATNSFIRRNTWRNGDIYETENGQGVFLGAINDVGFQSTDAGRQTIVNAREPFATMLELTCEEGTLISDTTLSDYYIVSDGDATETTLTLTDTGTPSDIQVGDIISFGNYNVPRYAVTSATGSPSTSITIDRPLERGVDGAIVRVIRPAIISGPKALKNAFTAAGLTNYLGGSFDTMDEDDIEQQFLLRVFVRIESRVKLADHIKKIMEMTDLYFTVNSFGIINIFRGLGYDGSNIRKSITTSEIIRPVEISYERQNLFAGYDCLFVSSTNTDVVSGDANTSTIAQWGSKERWQPIDDQGQSITAYQYLYANSRAAQYFGERKLNYNGEMRVRIKCACKRSPSGTTSLYGFNLGDQVQVTYDMGGGKSLTNEPARVVGYTYDRANQYYSDLVLELNSWVDETTEPIIELGEDDMRYLSAASSLTTTAGNAGSVYITADKGVYYWRDYVTSAPTADSDSYYATANGGETRWVRSGRPNAPQCEWRADTHAGYGSTDTKIPYFSNVRVNVDTAGAITVVNDSTNGCKITINTADYYTISFNMAPSAASYFGVSLNSTQLTTNIESITDSNRLCRTFASATETMHTSVRTWLAVNDVVRPHAAGSAAFIASASNFSITRG